ncbi:MAG: hypothetical protein E7544_00910 [Ruminococcaceae bacterium]|nr:hypothetical protein [Oscillospiraceae bacterium]
MKVSEKMRVAFVNILANLLPKEEAATIAASLETKEQKEEMFDFLQKRDFKATKQEIWNETGRIIKKHKAKY